MWNRGGFITSFHHGTFDELLLLDGFGERWGIFEELSGSVRGAYFAPRAVGLDL